MAFQPQVDTDAEFPLHPLFAHAHEQSVGCWVSIDGRIDCEYVELYVVVSCNHVLTA